MFTDGDIDVDGCDKMTGLMIILSMVSGLHDDDDDAHDDSDDDNDGGDCNGYDFGRSCFLSRYKSRILILTLIFIYVNLFECCSVYSRQLRRNGHRWYLVWMEWL